MDDLCKSVALKPCYNSGSSQALVCEQHWYVNRQSTRIFEQRDLDDQRKMIQGRKAAQASQEEDSSPVRHHTQSLPSCRAFQSSQTVSKPKTLLAGLCDVARG